MADVVVLIVVVAWLVVADVWALIDVGRRPAHLFPPVVGISKGAVAALIGLTGGLGGAYYLIRWRRRLINAEIGGRIPKPPRVPEDDGDYKEWRRTGNPWM